MPDGGTLTLIGQVNSDGKVSITVEDTGVGIPDAIKNQIFTPLFTTKPRGQGFGLAVCKRVIEAHGGNISFESTVGKGAKFMIQLPVN
jgi:signal transduction histidine kinase